jgi:hypothetical protein
MQCKLKLGALAWGIAAALAFPAGAAAARVGTVELPPPDNNAAVCNQLATGNTGGAFQCGQNNTATNTQTATATAGNGGTATGGNGGPVQVVGNHSKASSYGGDAYANGGDAEAHNSLTNEQSNQISGRDSSLGSYVGAGENNAEVCKQLATGNTAGNDQCHQSNTATNTQTATATGGNGGSATGGYGGPIEVVGNHPTAGSYGGDAYANGGDAEAHNSLTNEQANQISGRDSSGSDPAWSHSTEETDSTGDNNAAVCNQLATGDTMGNNQCRQDNTATNTQTTTTNGGNGGTATGGNGGPVQVVGDNKEAYSYGGDAYANGGDAESWTSLKNEQSNQISGRDSSLGSYLVDGDNNAAVCNLLATGNVFANDQCHQSNTATNIQTTTTSGGNGGEATGGDAGPSEVTSDHYNKSYSNGGDAYANGGDAESWTSLKNEQSNQISGRDSRGSDSNHRTKSKKHKKSNKRARSKVTRYVK